MADKSANEYINFCKILSFKRASRKIDDTHQAQIPWDS